MPNSGHITICPFYISERSKSVTCEDVFRRFKSKKDKRAYMDIYCDDNWQECRYAQKLMELYDEIETKGEKDQMLEMFRHKHLATREELKKVASQLGKAEARVDILNQENTELAQKVRYLREKNEELIKKYLDEKKEIKRREEKIYEEMMEQASIFEGYIAYLLSESKDKKLNVEAAYDWASNHAYTILGVHDEKGNKLKEMRVVVSEVKENGDNGSAAEVSEAGAGEDEKDGDTEKQG